MFLHNILSGIRSNDSQNLRFKDIKTSNTNPKKKKEFAVTSTIMPFTTKIIRVFAVFPCGSFASAGDDKKIRIGHVEIDKWHYRTLEGHFETVYALDVFPNNNWLISGSKSGTIKVWNVSDNECLKTFNRHSKSVRALAVFSNTFCFASGSDDCTIKIWNVLNAKCLKTLNGHSKSVRALVAFSDNLLVSASNDKTIRAWNIKSGKCEIIFPGHSGYVLTLAVLSNDLFASGSWDKTVRIWSVASRRCVKTFKHHAGVRSIAVLPGDGVLVSSSNDGKITFWDIKRGWLNNISSFFDSYEAHALAVLPNGSLISSSADTGNILIWDTAKSIGTEESIKILQSLQHNTSVKYIDLSKIELTALLTEALNELFRKNKTILSFTMSNSNLTDEFILYIKDGLRVNTSLTDIDLSNNCITYEGAKALIKAARNNPRLKKIDLRCNYINVDIKFLKKLCKPEKHCQQSFVIDISMNYLPHNCKKLLKNHGIFRTQPGIAKSIIAAEKSISDKDWLIFMLRDKKGDSEHAMIVIEGMRENGQQFIEMHDFRPITNTFPKKGRVNTHDYNPERTLSKVNGYKYVCYPMSSIIAKKLRRFINADKEKTLGYSRSGKNTKSSMRTYNCLTWVIAKLQEIGLNVKNPHFVAIPSLYITGQNVRKSKKRTECLVM